MAVDGFIGVYLPQPTVAPHISRMIAGMRQSRQAAVGRVQEFTNFVSGPSM
jgi:hypothetical protein